MAARGFSHPKTEDQKLRRRLREVARFVGGIVRAHSDGKGGLTDPASMTRILEAYSEVLGPWAERVMGNLIEAIDTRNLRAWAGTSAEIARRLRSDYSKSVAGQRARVLQAEQVRLIKSLPTEAGARAQRIAQEAQLASARAGDVSWAVKALDATGAVTEARAVMIARTEIAKANATLTRARAEFVGATHYIWRTMQDEAVRPAHIDMEGEVCSFADPPAVEGEGNHHPGEFPNCRCFAEPILPDVEGSAED